MDSIKSAVKSAKHTVQGGAATTSKEANKSVAKDGNVRMSTRLSAAKAAMGDKLNEQSHKRQADVHENKAKHNY